MRDGSKRGWRRESTKRADVAILVSQEKRRERSRRSERNHRRVYRDAEYKGGMVRSGLVERRLRSDRWQHDAGSRESKGMINKHCHLGAKSARMRSGGHYNNEPGLWVAKKYNSYQRTVI